jgi:DNA-binding MarR family transcriptional regulator
VRRLESGGLISVDTDPTDQRRRQLRWTVAGRAEVRELDRRSDLAASAVLDGLPAARQQRLLAAVAEVERSLRATPGQYNCIVQGWAHIARRPADLPAPPGTWS